MFPIVGCNLIVKGSNANICELFIYLKSETECFKKTASYNTLVAAIANTVSMILKLPQM